MENDELFERYGVRRMQLEMAVTALIAERSEAIVSKVVSRIIDQDLDPVSIALVEQMTSEFIEELFVWYMSQHPIAEPTIRWVDQDGNLLKEDPDPDTEEEDEEEPEEEYEEEEEEEDDWASLTFWERLRILFGK